MSEEVCRSTESADQGSLRYPLYSLWRSGGGSDVTANRTAIGVADLEAGAQNCAQGASSSTHTMDEDSTYIEPIRHSASGGPREVALTGNGCR